MTTGFESLASADEGDAPVYVEPEDDVELSPAEEADRPLVDALVREALDLLSPTDKEILLLCYDEQCSYEEIA